MSLEKGATVRGLADRNSANYVHTYIHTPQLRSLLIVVKIKLLELKYVHREHPSAQYSRVKTTLSITANSRIIYFDIVNE